jgi:predicted dehydrogenase
MTSSALKFLVVGARSTRQGTGPFIAAALHQQGTQICGVVGTSTASATEAARNLSNEHGIQCRAYTSLPEALLAESPDAVALCSPWQFHHQQLLHIAAADCHCLAEKPLLWPATGLQAEEVIAAFTQRALLLQVVAQWPCTLPSFNALHGPLQSPIEHFAMRLSPISLGPDMITDSAPHFLSMLNELLGPGECADTQIELTPNKDGDQLRLRCVYHHRAGATRAQLLLITCAQRPRPAWYEINGLRAQREVQLPEYQQYFSAGERRVAVPDPMATVVSGFLHALQTGAQTHGAQLLASLANLRQLADAWELQQ